MGLLRPADSWTGGRPVSLLDKQQQVVSAEQSSCSLPEDLKTVTYP